MLRAILQGKAGRITAENGEAQSWRDVFKLREDLLTSVFFSRFRYLSVQGEKRVLALLIGEDAAHDLGEVVEYHFWPKLAGAQNRSFVEPDVLIVCEKAVVLVEVKPPFGGGQYIDQWCAEISSLIIQGEDEDSAYCDLPDKIHFVALGNNAKDWTSARDRLEEEYSENGLRIHVREWHQVQRGIANLYDQDSCRDSAIYSDWKEAFILFGLVDKRFNFSNYENKNYKIEDCWQSSFDHWFFSDQAEIETSELRENKFLWNDFAEFSNKNLLEVQLWR